jgi:capsid assembly protease
MIDTRADVFGRPWALLPERLQVIAELAALRPSGVRLPKEEMRAAREAATMSAWSSGSDGQQSYGTIAVIPIRGILTHRANWISSLFGTSIDRLTSQFRRALSDASVRGIVFDVDSPGGSVDGIQELADEIYRSRSRKKSVAVANGLAASAAYWLAAAAGELAVTPSGQVGSIGVFAAHEDLSKALEQEGVKVTLVSAGKFKTDGNPFEPLSNSGRSDMQSKVNAFYEMFVKSVARGRSFGATEIESRFGRGRMILAKDAMARGMADRVATLDETIAKIDSGRAQDNRPAAARFRNIELMRRELEILGCY